MFQLKLKEKLMQRLDDEKLNRYLICIDILSIFKIASQIDWKEIRENSIYRIIYLTSVLYSFRYPDIENPFNIYKFIVNQSGPYDVNIVNALDFLIKDDYLKRIKGEDVLSLGANSIDDVYTIETDNQKYMWLKQVMYILGIYGENKIYEFIFRDPQYQTSIKSNTQQGLNIGNENETIKTLKSFQIAFEETLEKKNKKISSQTYLELYFEYIFSKILKREL